MKKRLLLFLVLCTVLTVLCACNNSKDTEDPADSTAQTQAATGEFANDNDAFYHDSWKKSNG